MTIEVSNQVYPWWVRSYRLFFSMLIVAAVGYQLWQDSSKAVNFFSFFTIQSNIIAAVVLLLGASMIPRFSTNPSWLWDMIRGAAAMYMVTTGIVYNTLLTGLDEELQTSEAWVNDTLHKVIPVVMVFDFILIPLLHRITFRQALSWTIYPFVYLGYSLIRGDIADWYPYPFIDPREDGGYGRVAAYSVAILIGFLLITWIVLRIAEWRGAGKQDAPNA